MPGLNAAALGWLVAALRSVKRGISVFTRRHPEKEFCSLLHRFVALNPAEKVLLAMGTPDPDTRAQIARALADEAKKGGKVSPWDRERIFRTCVGLSGDASMPQVGSS